MARSPDRTLVLNFPSLAHWIHASTLSHRPSHLDAVHRAATATESALLIVLRTPPDAPSPWQVDPASGSAQEAGEGTTARPASPPSAVPPPTHLFLPLEQALARVYNAATSAFFATDLGPLKSVDVVVEQLRDIAGLCIPAHAATDRWTYGEGDVDSAEHDARGKGKQAANNPDMWAESASASSASLPPLYPVVALGGTFDHLHAGHKILLTMACAICSSRLIVGVSDDHLLVSKKYKHLLQPIEERLQAVRRFVELIRPGVECDAVPIQDVYGPTAHDPSIGALVVSDETRSGGDTINQLRISRSLSRLEIFSISLVGDKGEKGQPLGMEEERVKVEVSAKMGSTGIREWLDRRSRVEGDVDGGGRG